MRSEGSSDIGRHGFGGLITDGQWARLLSAGRPRTFHEGESITRQGEYESTVFLLLEGTVKVTMVRPDGTALLLALRGPGESVGEMAALSGRPRSATTTPVSGRCLTRVLTSMQFRLLVKTMGLEDALWEHLVLRQTESDSLRAELASLPARQRLAATVVRLARLMGTPLSRSTGSDRRGVVLRMGLSQRELGDSIGLSRAAVAAEFRRLRELGVIRTGREHIVVVDIDRLCQLAEMDG